MSLYLLKTHIPPRFLKRAGITRGTSQANNSAAARNGEEVHLLHSSLLCLTCSSSSHNSLCFCSFHISYMSFCPSFPSRRTNGPVFNQAQSAAAQREDWEILSSPESRSGWRRKGRWKKDSQMNNFISISGVNQTPGLYWVTSWTEKQKEKEKETECDSLLLPNGRNRWCSVLLFHQRRSFKITFSIESVFQFDFWFSFPHSQRAFIIFLKSTFIGSFVFAGALRQVSI